MIKYFVDLALGLGGVKSFVPRTALDANALLWRALKALNDQMPLSKRSFVEAVSSIHQLFKLKGSTSRNFLTSCVPFACRHGELEALCNQYDLSFISDLRDTRNAWTLSLAIPISVIDGKVGDAADLLLELTKCYNKGWLNTECLRYAAEKLPEFGEKNQRFTSAFVNLLDSFQGDWYSRLHDTELLKTMLRLLEKTDSEPNESLFQAAIKHYGLSPVFWEQVETKPNILTTNYSWRAYQYWTCIREAFDHGLSQLTASTDVVSALAWYHRLGNIEALILLREAVCNLVNHEHSESKRKSFIQLLHEIDPLEVLGLETRAIWPTGQSMLEAQSNRLELLTSLEHRNRLLKEQLCVVSVMRNEMLILPHFLEHYRKLGIKSFIIVDNASTDGTLEYLLHQSDVILYTTNAEYRHSCYGIAWQQAILGNFCIGKWVIIADADEFLVYPDWEAKTLKRYLDEEESKLVDSMLIFMIDMYPSTDLANAHFSKSPPYFAAPCYDFKPLIEWHLGSGHYSNTISYLSGLRHRISKRASPNSFVSQKIALIRYRPWLRFSAGLHYAANNRLSDTKLVFTHFKYHAGFVDKVREEISREQHFEQAKEYRQYMDFIKNYGTSFSKTDVTAYGFDKVYETTINSLSKDKFVDI